jgi:Rrf2 family protein
MLKLSTKSRYAVRIMAYLAGSTSKGPIQVQEISRAESITSDYVEQILSRLKISGLVESHRGIRGGFTLTRPPSSVTIADIVRVTDGEIAIAPCTKGDCARAIDCAVQSVWQKVNTAVQDILRQTTLKDLTNEAARISGKGTLSFDI